MKNKLKATYFSYGLAITFFSNYFIVYVAKSLDSQELAVSMLPILSIISLFFAFFWDKILRLPIHVKILLLMSGVLTIVTSISMSLFSSFIGILCLKVVFDFLNYSFYPLLDHVVHDIGQKERTIVYSNIRLFGSLGSALSLGIMGYFLHFINFYMLTAICYIAVTLFIASLYFGTEKREHQKEDTKKSVPQTLDKKIIWHYIFPVGVILGSSQVIGSLQGLYLQNISQNFEFVFAATIFFSIIVEVLMFLIYPRIMKKTKEVTFLIIGCVLFLLRIIMISIFKSDILFIIFSGIQGIIFVICYNTLIVIFQKNEFPISRGVTMLGFIQMAVGTGILTLKTVFNIPFYSTFLICFFIALSILPVLLWKNKKL